MNTKTIKQAFWGTRMAKITTACAVISSILAGCKPAPTEQAICLEPLPVLRAPVEDGSVIYLDHTDAYQWIADKFEEADAASIPYTFFLPDSKYAAIYEPDFMLLCAWLHTHYSRFGIHFRDEDYDCDTFAQDISYWAGKAGLFDPNAKGVQLAVASIAVLQERAWGGVQAGGGHAVNGVILWNYDAAGKVVFSLKVLEPQSLRKWAKPIVTELSDYPNKKSIYRIDVSR